MLIKVMLLGNIFVFIVGLILLAISSNFLIKTSVKIAYLLKLSTLFVGLIFIAFGTSCPEAAVSITAVIRKYKDIALGNIIGSNIANIGLVLGLCGLLKPFRLDSFTFKREMSIMLLSSLLLFGFCWDGVLSRLEGSFFILGFILFCFFSYQHSKTHQATEDFKLTGYLRRVNSKLIVFGLFCVSLVFIVLGANLMVNSGVNIAKFFKISPLIIGLTVFSIGTSLPELGASLAAIFKKVPSISIGNVMGSNIFNVFFVLGIISLIRPLKVDTAILRFELPVLIIFSISIALFMGIKRSLSRFEAGILFLCYIGFIVLLFVR